MKGSSAQDVSFLLRAWSSGDKQALDNLIPLVYDELHRLAHHYVRGERAGQTLQTTALLNEAYLRLVDTKKVKWRDRAHFFAVSAGVMRRILVDIARSRKYKKRGGNTKRVPVDDALHIPTDLNLVKLDDALNTLAGFDARKAKLVELRFFGGLSVKETAEVLKVSPQTVKRDWSLAKVWLLRELKCQGSYEA